MREAARLLAQIQLPLNIDVVEAAPTEEEGESSLWVGCYQLNEEGEATTRRHGGLYLCTYHQMDQQEQQQQSGSINIKREILLDWGCLDLRVCADNVVICVGSDDKIHYIGKDATPIRPKSDTSEAIGLSLDVCNSNVLWSSSDGYCHLHSAISSTLSWKAHDAEVWSCAFLSDNEGDNQLIASGADDAILKIWDTRLGLSNREHSRPVMFNKTAHQAGVTSLTPLPHSSSSPLLLSGSYDQRIRLWDLRHLDTPISEVELGGGIWRMKFSGRRRVAVAATHGGSYILEIDESSGFSFDVVSEYRGVHTSMVYGISSLRNDDDLYVSGSFYDKRIAVWTPAN